MRNKNTYYINLFKNIIKKIRAKYLSLSIPKQIVLVGSIGGIFSLFLPWIVENEKQIKTWNSFHTITGNVGYILMVIFFIQLFLVLSNFYKEKLKLYSEIDFKNHFIIIISGIFTIILSIVTLSFISGLDMFGGNIKYGNGPIFCIISGILIFIGGIFIRINFKKNNSEIILEEMAKNREKNKQAKENMELPF